MRHQYYLLAWNPFLCVPACPAFLVVNALSLLCARVATSSAHRNIRQLHHKKLVAWGIWVLYVVLALTHTATWTSELSASICNHYFFLCPQRATAIAQQLPWMKSMKSITVWSPRRNAWRGALAQSILFQRRSRSNWTSSQETAAETRNQVPERKSGAGPDIWYCPKLPMC